MNRVSRIQKKIRKKKKKPLSNCSFNEFEIVAAPLNLKIPSVCISLEMRGKDEKSNRK